MDSTQGASVSSAVISVIQKMASSVISLEEGQAEGSVGLEAAYLNFGCSLAFASQKVSFVKNGGEDL